MCEQEGRVSGPGKGGSVAGIDVIMAVEFVYGWNGEGDECKGL